MRIDRKQSILLALLLFGGFALTTALILNSDRTQLGQSPESQVSDSQASNSPNSETNNSVPVDKRPNDGANFAMNDFHRVEMRDGKKIWEVTASRGQYFPANNSALVDKAHLVIFKKDGSIIELNAGSATLFLDGASLSKAEASQGVKLQLDQDTVLTSDTANFDRIKNTVLVPGNVEINNSRMNLKGKKLEADLTKEEFRIFNDVDTTVLPKYSEQP